MRASYVHLGIALALVAMMAPASGCFDIHTAKRIFYPSNDTAPTMKPGTIAEVQYDYKGPVDTLGTVRIGAAEFHREIDNFHIAPGGGNIYLWVQAHFIYDSGIHVTFARYINVTLSYLPEDGSPELRLQGSYSSQEGSEVDIAERIGPIDGPEPGLWSLMVEGVGTSIVSGGVASYDWFHVTVNGQYSDRSYNNDAPTDGGAA